MEPVLEITLHLNRWLRWYRLCRAATWSVRGLAIGLGFGLLVSLFAVDRGMLLRDEFITLLLWIASAGLILGGVTAYAWPFSRLRAARYFDLRFGLHERISTALELAGNVDLHSEPAGLYRKQADDALSAARRVDARSRLPIHIAWQEILLVLLFALGAFLSFQWGRPHFQAAQEARAVQQAIAQEAAEVDAILSKIRNNPRLTPQQKEALTAPLEEARQQLEQAQTLEQSVSILTRAEGELNSLSNLEAQVRMQALRQLGQNLGEAQGSPLLQIGEQLSAGDTPAAAQALNDLDLSQMGPAQRETLAQQLVETASSLVETDPELADQLQDTAERLRAGDIQDGQQALQDAARSLSESGERIEGSAQAGQAAAALEAGRQRLLQQAGSENPLAAAGEQQDPDSGGTGPAGNPGSTDGMPPASNGQSGLGSGAGRGEDAGEAGTGSQAGSDPIDQGNGPGDEGERPYEPISPPEQPGRSGGDVVALPGSGQSGDTITGEGDLPFDGPGRSQVPYMEVYPQYAEIYRQAIESGQVPLGLRSVVRDYFSSLEPLP